MRLLRCWVLTCGNRVCGMSAIESKAEMETGVELED